MDPGDGSATTGSVSGSVGTASSTPNTAPNNMVPPPVYGGGAYAGMHPHMSAVHPVVMHSGLVPHGTPMTIVNAPQQGMGFIYSAPPGVSPGPTQGAQPTVYRAMQPSEAQGAPQYALPPGISIVMTPQGPTYYHTPAAAGFHPAGGQATAGPTVMMAPPGMQMQIPIQFPGNAMQMPHGFPQQQQQQQQQQQFAAQRQAVAVAQHQHQVAAAAAAAMAQQRSGVSFPPHQMQTNPSNTVMDFSGKPMIAQPIPKTPQQPQARVQPPQSTHKSPTPRMAPPPVGSTNRPMEEVITRVNMPKIATKPPISIAQPVTSSNTTTNALFVPTTTAANVVASSTAPVTSANPSATATPMKPQETVSAAFKITPPEGPSKPDEFCTEAQAAYLATIRKWSSSVLNSAVIAGETILANEATSEKENVSDPQPEKKRSRKQTDPNAAAEDGDDAEVTEPIKSLVPRYLTFQPDSHILALANGIALGVSTDGLPRAVTTPSSFSIGTEDMPKSSQSQRVFSWLRVQDDGDVRKKVKRMCCMFCADYNSQSPWAQLKPRRWDIETFVEHENGPVHIKALRTREAMIKSGSIPPSAPLPVSAGASIVRLSRDSRADQFPSSAAMTPGDDESKRLKRQLPSWVEMHTFPEVPTDRIDEYAGKRKKYRLMCCHICRTYQPESPWGSVRPRKNEQQVMIEHERSSNHRKSVEIMNQRQNRANK